MNRREYNSDPRYAKVLEQMDLLGIMDISTTRQAKNGTIVWKLPIKNEYGGKLIEVASFRSGYVRNQNSAYSNYQLNKQRKYPPTKWSNGYEYSQTYRELIPIEIDRLEYLISYCLKNYYINQANEIENGNYITKWKHEYEMKNGSLDRVIELQSENRKLHNIYLKQTTEIQELQKRFEETAMELDELHVTVNGHKYKVI